MGTLSDLARPETKAAIMATSTESESKKKVIWLFGNFFSTNLGNDATLQTFHDKLQGRLPEAEFCCICSGPEATASSYGIRSKPIVPTFFDGWAPKNRIVRMVRSLVLGPPSELCRWLIAFAAFRRGDVLIVPGTGILTDAFGLTGWGPYSLFKWCAAARLSGCKVFFVSIGAGPLHRRSGRFFAKSAVAMSEFCSYRDDSSRDYMKSIGFDRGIDRVSPDLVFSKAAESVSSASPLPPGGLSRRPAVGVGVMLYAAHYSSAGYNENTFPNYLHSLLNFANGLVAKDYAIRILIGDRCDVPVAKELLDNLRQCEKVCDNGRAVYEEIETVDQLHAQIDRTDIVVATRFHNVLLALLAEKPVIAISFHPKVSSLMNDFGLSDYCLDINTLTGEALRVKFEQAEREAGKIKAGIAERLQSRRSDLEKQYDQIVSSVRK
jgi:polysaccharide pyruvyl transferase WcaK-like protein